MSLLFSVITAAWASGTHHRLALDGVRRLQGPAGEAWQRLFLKHADLLVKGAKAPDDEFKDFKNHVLHPRDNFWGGAPEKARAWYTDLVEALSKGDWPAAVWSAGVLSHYVTDPINPFHTQQSEAESSIHRAFEWSISRSYDALKKIAAADAARTINVVDDDTWLEQLLAMAATDANQHYEKLIAHYDIHRGVVDPPSGLDVVAQRIVGDMIGLASAVFATVLQHAITDSKATPPDVSLTLDLVLSTLRIPFNKLTARLADRQERAQVEAMYDELKATGTVEKHLPEDDRVVRDAYAAEVLAVRPAADTAARFPVRPQRPAETEAESRERLKRVGRRSVPVAGDAHARAKPLDRRSREVPVDDRPRPAPRAADQLQPAGPVSRTRGEPIAAPTPPAPAPVAVEPAAIPEPEAVTVPLPLGATTTPVSSAGAGVPEPAPVPAPLSLAERLASAGSVRTVQQKVRRP